MPRLGPALVFYAVVFALSVLVWQNVALAAVSCALATLLGLALRYVTTRWGGPGVEWVAWIAVYSAISVIMKFLWHMH